MNWNQIEGNWEQFKGKVQTQWGKLTDDDLDVIKGNRKQLAGRLQERYGKAQDEADRDIDNWLARHLASIDLKNAPLVERGVFVSGRAMPWQAGYFWRSVQMRV